jgi:broad specificity phosphatase PhoE
LSNVGNRDALLSPLGIEQAQSLGNELREREINFDMIVVSPMRRTLETSIHILGNDIMKSTNVETIVQPLAAEHNGGTFTNNRINQVRSVVARGDLGSSPDELRKTFDFATYPQFKEFNGLENGWWKHGQEDGFETNESFELRAKNLRTWLGSTGRELTNKRKRNGNSESDSLPTILLVSHGGILSKTFDFGSDGTTEFARSGGKMQNCEIRVFDVSESGDYIRPIGKDECEVMDVGDGLIGGGGGGSSDSSGAAFVNDDKNTEEDEPSLLAPARPPRPTRR